MANCVVTLSGIPYDCESNKGGIKKVFIADYSTVSKVDVADEKITGITLTETNKFKTYEFRKGTGNVQEQLSKDETAGSYFVTGTITLVFTRKETSKRVEVSALAKGRLAVIVEDSNGKYWYYGKDDYVTASGDTVGQSGTANTDSNNYTVVLTSSDDDFAYEIDQAIIADIVE